MNNNITAISLSAEKASVVLDHLMTNYLDSAFPDRDMLRYDWRRVQYFAQIAYDYIRQIASLTDTIGKETSP